ncbi:MAG: hypothetical protein V1918_09515 [Planctomycetota bacterium]
MPRGSRVRKKGLAVATAAAFEVRPPRKKLALLRSTTTASPRAPGPGDASGRTGSRSGKAARAKDRRRRVDFAIDRLCEGFSDRRILSALSEAFAVPAVQARRDLAGAYRLLEGIALGQGPEARLSRAVLQRDEIVRRALEKEDLRVSLSALDSRDKLLGLLDRETFARDEAARTLLEVAELAYRTRPDERPLPGAHGPLPR